VEREEERARRERKEGRRWKKSGLKRERGIVCVDLLIISLKSPTCKW
jgi:hypothetical protein